MWATLAFSAALSLAPAQRNNLDLQNPRVTYSVLGPERKDSKIYPGDVYVLSFDIVGLTAENDGEVRYSMGMELTRKVKGGKPKLEFRQAPRQYKAVNTLGGTTLPSYALAAIGTDAEEGEYTLKVTVTDRNAKPKPVTRELVRTFQVVPVELGFVRVGLSYNADLPAPAVAVAGQTLWLNFFLVGFTLDKKKRPDLAIEMTVLDEAKKPTVSKPRRGEIKKLADESVYQLLPFDPIALQLNKPGKYTVVLKAIDHLKKKETERRIALTVLDNK
jgi:hypothetical protein